MSDLLRRFSSQSSASDPADARFDVACIGNALVDVLASAEERFLDDHGLVKGSMTLVETERAIELYSALGHAVEMSGGSAANTACGIASFGGRAAYIGKVNGDDLGNVFGHDMRALGVAFNRPPGDHGTPTGRCVIVVTPDAERTMNTYLGVSSELCVDDLDESMIADASVLYMEGYLFDRDDAKAAFRRAAEIAHEHGRIVSLTLSDSFCVDRHRADFRGLVQDSVDLLFGNHDELLSLYELDSFDEAVEALRAECDVAAITVGADGCVIVTQEELIRVDAVPVDKVLDTTGAGDLFASGFLYGLTAGADLATCGRYGSIAASEVISHVGPRPLVELRNLLGDG
ncbi:MAG: adenosine kinase [Ilumatobacteraceae bacterium]